MCDEQPASVPRGHATEHRRHVSDHEQGITRLKQLHRRREPVLHYVVAQAIFAASLDHLVALSSDGVQFPLVQHPRNNHVADAVSRMGDNVVENPSRVVSPGFFERPVPNALRVARDVSFTVYVSEVVARDLYNAAKHEELAD